MHLKQKPKYRKKRKIFIYMLLISNLIFGHFRLNTGTRNGQNNFSFDTAQEIKIPNIRGGDQNILYRFEEHPRLVKEIVKLTPKQEKASEKLIIELAISDQNYIEVNRIQSLHNVYSATNDGDVVIFFRKTEIGLEILAKTSNNNQDKIINLLSEFNY